MKTPRKYPIEHWSHSSLMAFLRNPLAWHKRYVEKIYDMAVNPSSVIGRAAHAAMEHFYLGETKEEALAAGLAYLRSVPDFEINFGKAESKKAKKEKRQKMEREYLQAVGYYLARPPRHTVLAAEARGTAKVKGLPLPLKAVSDLIVESKGNPGAVDVVDHKFVDSFSSKKEGKTLFVMQAIFNYYTAFALYGRPVKRFIVYECKKKENRDGSAQLRKYVLNYEECGEDFALFHRLVKDATRQLANTKVFLPNPSDMFDGENSVDIYRLGL